MAMRQSSAVTQRVGEVMTRGPARRSRLAGCPVEVMPVARRPEVFVHELEPEQAQRLVKITRSTRDRVRLRRAGVVLASVQGRSAGEIAMMFAASENYVRGVIHAFNDQGFAALDPKWSGGRPPKFGPAAHQLICHTARSDPHALGQPFTTWSLTDSPLTCASTIDWSSPPRQHDASCATPGSPGSAPRRGSAAVTPTSRSRWPASWISTTIHPSTGGCCVLMSSGR